MQDPLSACSGDLVNFTLSNLPGPASSYTVGWETSIDQGTTIFYGNPSSSYEAYPNQTYTVNFTSSNASGCDGTLKGNFAVNTSLCNVGTIHNSPTLISYGGGTVSIQNDVDVTGNIFLNGTNVLISPGKTITVKPGASLTVKGSWLHACNCNWNGIIVEKGGNLTVETASIIENAETAITILAQSGTCNVKLSNAMINACENGIDLQSSGAINMNGFLVIDKSIFTCRKIISQNIYNNMTNFLTLYDHFFLTPLLDDLNAVDALSLSNTIDGFAPKAVFANGGRTNIGLKISNHKGSTLKPFTGAASMFDNMDFGVYADISSINIDGPHFMNMEGNNNNGKVSGIAVYTVDPKNGDLTSECIVNTCLMKKVCRGVHIENIVNTLVLGNMFDNETTYNSYNTTAKLPGQYGVYYSFFAGTNAALLVPTTWEIKRNCIRNYNTGAAIIRNNYVGYSVSEFSCNTIFGSNDATGTADPFCNIGLLVNDGVGAGGVGGPQGVEGGLTLVYGNDIVKVKANAINLTNVHQNFEIRKNINSITQGSAFGPYIYNTHGPLGFTLKNNSPKARTISMVQCSNIIISHNALFGFYQTIATPQAYQTTGIYCEKSTARIFENTIRNNKNDIWFFGKCNPSIVGLNTFAAASNAMYFSNDAQIGPQGNPTSPAGNRFVTSQSLGVIKQTNMANVNVQPVVSPFYYRNVATAGNTTEIMANADQAYSAPAPSTNVYLNSATGGLIGINYMAGAVFDPPYNCGISTPAPPPPPVDDPATLHNMADSILYVKGLILDHLPNQPYAAEKHWNNKLHALRVIEKNIPAFTQDAVIDAFYTNNQTTDLGKLNQVYAYAEAGQTQLAESINNTINGIEPNENYRKAVNHIHLSMVNDSLYEHDSSSIAALLIIANACPDQLGKVVYEARNLLMGHKKQVLDFEDACLTHGNGNGNQRIPQLNYGEADQSLTQNLYVFSLYPNPNNGTFTLVNKLGKGISGTLSVYDLLGKVLVEQEVQNASLIEVNLNKETYNKGIYFVRLTDENNKLLYIGKTIVQ